MSDNKPISGSDAIFARAYANAIKTKFQLDVGQHHCILTSPVTQRGVAAGEFIPSEMTNYLIYKLADSLHYADDPSYTGGSAGSYLQQLRSYIEWVKTSANPSQVAANRLATARRVDKDASDEYEKVWDAALARYEKVKAQFPGLTFQQWASSEYPRLATADRSRKAAQAELFQAMQQYYGPDAATLTSFVTALTNAQNGFTEFPGYNQAGTAEDKDNIAWGIDQANNGNSVDKAKYTIIRVPAYSIATYISGVQAWIAASGHGAKRDQVITIDVKQGRNTKWEDYGFKEVRRGGGVGFWPFFYAEVYHNGQWESRTLETSGREDQISIQLAMIGIQKFDIQPGQWDIPNIRALFPNRLPNAPEVLSSKYARVVSLLVGYDVELNLEFASEMREEINKIYEEVKATGGRMSIFGFWVSAAGSNRPKERVNSKFEDVKWDKVKGKMSLTPTKGQVYPTILAAVAQRFDSE